MTEPQRLAEPLTDAQTSALSDDDDYDPERPGFGSLAVMQLARAHSQRARAAHAPDQPSRSRHQGELSMDTPTAPLAPPDAYVASLDAAADALGVAIRTCLEGGSTWRFAEVQRLCKIGQAITRMRARANPTVAGYVEPTAAMRPGGNCGIGGVDPFAEDDLGLDPVQPNVFPHRVLMNPVGPVPPNPVYGFGPNVAQAQPLPAGPVDGAMEMLRTTLATIEHNDNKRSNLDLLHELRNLGELLETELDPHARAVLQSRREEILATIGTQTDLDRRTREARSGASAPTQTRHARCDGCGTAHDHDWVTEDGRLRACDVCGGPMRWSDEEPAQRALPPTLDSEETPSPPEPKENETPCPPSSSRTSGTSRRRTATSASKRSATARQS